jgi:hypothetical protein
VVLAKHVENVEKSCGAVCVGDDHERRERRCDAGTHAGVECEGWLHVVLLERLGSAGQSHTEGYAFEKQVHERLGRAVGVVFRRWCTCDVTVRVRS